MSYTYIRRELSHEEDFAQLIASAAEFAEMCAWRVKTPSGLERKVFLHMINRLETGDVLDLRDDQCIAVIGRDLISKANALKPGYGTFLMNSYRYEPVPLSAKLAQVHQDLLLFERFQGNRCRLRCRLKARAQLKALEES
ncbi:MAG: hypothetical protein P8P66_13445 [Paracoccaceae bacterium]|nr:hypothetical protein [Paracoccaceae bacterium]